MSVAFTSAMIGVLFVLLALYDCVVFGLYGPEPTISRAMYRISLEWNIVIAVWGGLGAHFFMVHKPHCYCSWWEEIKPIVLLVAGFITFRLGWVQTIK